MSTSPLHLHLPRGVTPPEGVRWGFSGRDPNHEASWRNPSAVGPVGSLPEQEAGVRVGRWVRELDPQADPGRVVWLEQVHGVEVHHATGPTSWGGARPRADAVWTDQPGLVLAVQVADCVPVLLGSRWGVAALHAGWRGVTGGVIQAGVKAFLDGVGLSASEVVAAVGPCIGPAAFEVGPEVVEAWEAAFSPGSRWVRPGSGDRSFVDLRGGVVEQLHALGVHQVGHVDACTTGPGWFSWRRDGPGCGRQAGWVTWRGP